MLQPLQPFRYGTPPALAESPDALFHRTHCRALNRPRENETSADAAPPIRQNATITQNLDKCCDRKTGISPRRKRRRRKRRRRRVECGWWEGGGGIHRSPIHSIPEMEISDGWPQSVRGAPANGRQPCLHLPQNRSKPPRKITNKMNK